MTDISREEHDDERAADQVDREELRALDAETLRKQFRTVAVGYLILLVFFVIGLVVLERRDIARSEKVQATALNRSLKAQIAACDRVNRLRERVNDNALVLFVATQVNISREQKLAKIGPKADRKVHAQSAKSSRVLQKRYQFQPLTNCKLAVYQPETFVPRETRSFRKDEKAVKNLTRRIIPQS